MTEWKKPSLILRNKTVLRLTHHQVATVENGPTQPVPWTVHLWKAHFLAGS